MFAELNFMVVVALSAGDIVVGFVECFRDLWSVRFATERIGHVLLVAGVIALDSHRTHRTVKVDARVALGQERAVH